MNIDEILKSQSNSPDLKTEDCRKRYYKSHKQEAIDAAKRWKKRNPEKVKEGTKIYREKNKQKIKESNKTYNEVNKEERNKKYKIYREKNKQEILCKQRLYRKEHPEKAREYMKKRREEPQFKLQQQLRHRLNMALKGNFKKSSAVESLGCTIQELKEYIETLFLPGMNWDNWTTKGWHLDHVVPISSFDLKNKDEILKACHFSNLQPLWWIDNLTKSNKTL